MNAEYVDNSSKLETQSSAALYEELRRQAAEEAFLWEALRRQLSGEYRYNLTLSAYE